MQLYFKMISTFLCTQHILFNYLVWIIWKLTAAPLAPLIPLAPGLPCKSTKRDIVFFFSSRKSDEFICKYLKCTYSGSNWAHSTIRAWLSSLSLRSRWASGTSGSNFSLSNIIDTKFQMAKERRLLWWIKERYCICRAWNLIKWYELAVLASMPINLLAHCFMQRCQAGVKFIQFWFHQLSLIP